MHWVDLLAIGIIILLGFIESRRGFGLALFDIIGAVIIVKIVIALTPSVAETMSMGMAEQEAEGVWLLILFVVFAALVVLISHTIHKTTLLSLDVMDPIIGAILGLASGIVLAHVVLRSMVLIYENTALGDALMETVAVQQLVEFRGYLLVLDALTHLGEV